MALLKVATLSKLPPGSLIQVYSGDDAFAVCNVDGEIHVLDGICPHAAGPIGEGALHGHTIVCPWHAWEYDCRTGVCEFNDQVRLVKFPVRIEGDDILIELATNERE